MDNLEYQPEFDVAPLERIKEFDGAINLSYEQSLSDASYAQPIETTRASRLATYSQAGAAKVAPSSSLTKAELADLLCAQLGLNKRETKDLVDAFFDELVSALERGESVKLTGLGNFQLRDKVSRPGRNPKTGVEVQISARRVVTFQASQTLKDMLDSCRQQATSTLPAGSAGTLAHTYRK